MPNLKNCMEKNHMFLNIYIIPKYMYIHIYYGVCMYHMGVSENNGTPKSSILIGCSIINHPFWGTPIFGNTHIFVVISLFLIHFHPFF